MAEDFQMCQYRSAAFRTTKLIITNDNGFGLDADLYEGGRRGVKRNLEDYGGGGGGSDDDGDDRDAEASLKKKRTEAIRQEFDRRKGNVSKKEEKLREKEKQKDEEEFLKYSKAGFIFCDTFCAF